MDDLLVLLWQAFARIYAMLRYPDPASAPERKSTIVVALLVTMPILAAAVAVALYILTSPT